MIHWNFVVNDLIVLLHLVDHFPVDGWQLHSRKFLILSQVQILEISLHNHAEIFLFHFFGVGVPSEADYDELKLKEHDAWVACVEVAVLTM